MIPLDRMLPVVGLVLAICAVLTIRRYARGAAAVHPGERAAAVVSLVLAILASVVLLVVPAYTGEKVEIAPDGRNIVTPLGDWLQ